MHELLLEYGVDALAETIVEGFSRVRRCNNEGRALMSLDLQVCRSGLCFDFCAYLHVCVRLMQLSSRLFRAFLTVCNVCRFLSMACSI
jgi:hypothetical protein